jgi:uncharacterized YccA/Bax inhibitor family protein
MTIEGTVNRTAILLFLMVCGAAYTWDRVYASATPGADIRGLMLSGVFGGMIFALVTVFVPRWAAVTAPLYAILEGLALGAISALVDARFPDVRIALQAVLITVGILGFMLLAYRTGMIRVTDRFRAGVVAATGGVFVAYLLSFVLGFFGIQVPFLHSSGPVGILISFAIVIVASLNLVLDFDFIAQHARRGSPKYMEWFAAFGLILTLVWLYLEILRLLSKLNSRR